MTDLMLLGIIFTTLLFVAGLCFTNLYLQSKETLVDEDYPFVVKITKASGRVTYGVKYLSDPYAGSYWEAESDEYDTFEEAQQRVDRVNDQKIIKVERYK